MNVIPVESGVSRSTSKTASDTAATAVLPFSTGWHCPYCDLDIRPPTVGLFSFNNPLGACPDCRGFGRTIAIDLNKAIPDRSLSIKQGVVRVFRGLEFGESQKDLLRACAREDIDINLPFDELPKADQEFVIEGERRSGEYADDDYGHDRWYGVRGFFRWHSSSYRGKPRGQDNVFRFLRSCEYGLPQLFSVVELFARRIWPQTNYSLFIAEMPRWFRAEVLKNLDEQGVPVQISERFLKRGDTIDTLRHRLIQEALSSRTVLTPFEKRWVLDALAN